jgi:hypothetical protein
MLFNELVMLIKAYAEKYPYKKELHFGLGTENGVR